MKSAKTARRLLSVLVAPAVVASFLAVPTLAQAKLPVAKTPAPKGIVPKVSPKPVVVALNKGGVSPR